MQGLRSKRTCWVLLLALALVPAASWAGPTDEDAKSADEKKSAEKTETEKAETEAAENDKAEAGTDHPAEASAESEGGTPLLLLNRHGEVCKPSNVNTLEDLFAGGGYLLRKSVAPAPETEPAVTWREVEPQPKPEG